MEDCIPWTGKHSKEGRPILRGGRYAYRGPWEKVNNEVLLRTEQLVRMCPNIGCVNGAHYVRKASLKSNICVVADCETAASRVNLCSAHYHRLLRHGDPQIQLRATSNPGKDAAVRKSWVIAYKLERGCTDCGYKEHHAALDFDHLPGSVKVRDIKSGQQLGWTALLEEVEKCEVVCSNCHRIRTYERRREVMIAC